MNALCKTIWYWVSYLLVTLIFGIVAGIGNVYAKISLNTDLGSGSPATWYAALLITMPTDGDGTSLVEASWTSYARPAITNNSTNFPMATVVSHIAQVACQASVSFGGTGITGLSGSITVSGIALFDASSAGNMGRTAVFGTIATPVTYVLNNGSTLSFAGGNLIFFEQ